MVKAMRGGTSELQRAGRSPNGENGGAISPTDGKCNRKYTAAACRGKVEMVR